MVVCDWGGWNDLETFLEHLVSGQPRHLLVEQDDILVVSIQRLTAVKRHTNLVRLLEVEQYIVARSVSSSTTSTTAVSSDDIR